jgi:hypothetical protein
MTAPQKIPRLHLLHSLDDTWPSQAVLQVTVQERCLDWTTCQQCMTLMPPRLIQVQVLLLIAEPIPRLMLLPTLPWVPCLLQLLQYLLLQLHFGQDFLLELLHLALNFLLFVPAQAEDLHKHQ